jgi:hypothetical protein
VKGNRVVRTHLHDDPMSAATEKAADFLRENGRNLAIGLGVVVVVAIGILVWNSTRSGGETAARGLLGRAQASLAQGQVEGAAGQLDELVRRHGGTVAGRQGYLLLGEVELRRGNHTAAEGHFRGFIGKSSSSDYFWSAAQRGLGVALENQGKHADAARAYEAALTGPIGDNEKGMALLDAARARILAGDTAGAHAAYDRVVKEFPATRAAATAKVRQAEMGPAAP